MTRQYTNTAHLFAATGKWQYHDKVQLVPLGEAVPLRDYLPFLRAFGVVERDLLPGRSLKPLEVRPDAHRRGHLHGIDLSMDCTRSGAGGRQHAGGAFERVVVWTHGSIGAASGVLRFAGD
jgi:hypothetical protein